MNLQSYLERRQLIEQETKKFRTLCLDCMQPDYDCYCAHVQPFDPNIKFVILIHPLERRRRIATGRMASLCLKNSELILGQDYTRNQKLNDILSDTSYQPVVLYPGRQSINISNSTFHEKKNIFSPEKKPLLVVIDGTWSTAKKMIRRSQNLVNLPRICFTPPGPSQFRVRKQPRPECYSTIEAIHHTIELLGEPVGFNTGLRAHDNLIDVFKRMVEKQLTFIKVPKRRRAS